MKTLNLTFEDKDYKKLRNAKEEAKILGTCKSWEEFIFNSIIEKEVSNGKTN